MEDLALPWPTASPSRTSLNKPLGSTKISLFQHAQCAATGWCGEGCGQTREGLPHLPALAMGCGTSKPAGKKAKDGANVLPLACACLLCLLECRRSVALCSCPPLPGSRCRRGLVITDEGMLTGQVPTKEQPPASAAKGAR